MTKHSTSNISNVFLTGVSYDPKISAKAQEFIIRSNKQNRKIDTKDYFSTIGRINNLYLEY